MCARESATDYIRTACVLALACTFTAAQFDDSNRILIKIHIKQ